jgi:hypothetical protein
MQLLKESPKPKGCLSIAVPILAAVLLLTWLVLS